MFSEVRVPATYMRHSPVLLREKVMPCPQASISSYRVFMWLLLRGSYSFLRGYLWGGGGDDYSEGGSFRAIQAMLAGRESIQEDVALVGQLCRLRRIFVGNLRPLKCGQAPISPRPRAG